MIYSKKLKADFISNRYQSMASLPGFVLLQSAPNRGRYDILTALPIDSFVAGDLDAWMKQWPLTDSKTDFPFIGGVIGWLSYETCLDFHQLPTAPKTYLNLPNIELRYYVCAIIFDKVKKKAHLVWNDWFPNIVEKTKKHLLEAWNNSRVDTLHAQLETPFLPELSKVRYSNAIESIKESIQMGRVYQINFTQAFKATFQGEPWALYQKLQKENRVPYGAFWKGENYNILSFSPECFIEIENNMAITRPIKGSVGRGQNEFEDNERKTWLTSSEKNRAENIMIVDLLRNDFGRLAKPASVKVNYYCQLQTFKSVHHLVSEVSAILPKDQHVWDFVKSCMPGGSITGAPKREAMKVITELEDYQRGPYCGHLFYHSMHNRFDSNILIRTILCENKTAILNVGGGIVIDSNVDDEYAECLAKIKSLIQVLM
jgi:para-aminobenzoate synthetase component 1